jgi:uncharacterized phiE125 gp8 family phage protein
MLIRRIIPMTDLPVTLTDLKAQVRVTFTDDDDLLTALLGAAVELVSGMSGRVLAPETWSVSFDRVPAEAWTVERLYTRGVMQDIRLPKSPVRALTNISYYDPSGVSQTASVDNFWLFLDDDRASVRPKPNVSWPITQAREDAITITFTAGYTALPPALKAAILMLAAQWYETREASTAGPVTEVPLAAQTLIDMHRIGWVG